MFGLTKPLFHRLTSWNEMLVEYICWEKYKSVRLLIEIQITWPCGRKYVLQLQACPLTLNPKTKARRACEHGICPQIQFAMLLMSPMAIWKMNVPWECDSLGARHLASICPEYKGPKRKADPHDEQYKEQSCHGSKVINAIDNEPQSKSQVCSRPIPRTPFPTPTRDSTWLMLVASNCKLRPDSEASHETFH